MARVVTLAELPKCNFCENRHKDRVPNDAIWDAPTHYGLWAYMCQTHFELEASVKAESALANKLVARA